MRKGKNPEKKRGKKNLDPGEGFMKRSLFPQRGEKDNKKIGFMRKNDSEAVGP